MHESVANHLSAAVSGMKSYGGDGGIMTLRSLPAGVASNHLKWHWLRAVVVSVEGKVEPMSLGR